MKPPRLKAHHFHSKLLSQKPVLRQIEWRLQNRPMTKSGVLPVTVLIFRKFVPVLEPLKGPYIKYVGGGPEGFCGGHEVF